MRNRMPTIRQPHTGGSRCAGTSGTRLGSCNPRYAHIQPLAGYTLIEVVLVMGIILVLTALAVPNFYRELERNALPRSGNQLRSLLTLVAANAAFDGKRIRIRFAVEGEEESPAGKHQPIIEREDDPFYEPEVFNLVTSPWAVGAPLLGEVWCAEVRLGRPSIEELQRARRRSDIEDALIDSFDDFDPERPPLIFHPDGTCDWVTMVLTTAPPNTRIDELERFDRVEVIFEGETGLAWLQRPFYEEELDLFEEKGWPAVLRQDFLSPRVLTENDVLELRDVNVNR